MGFAEQMRKPIFTTFGIEFHGFRLMLWLVVVAALAANYLIWSDVAKGQEPVRRIDVRALLGADFGSHQDSLRPFLDEDFPKKKEFLMSGLTKPVIYGVRAYYWEAFFSAKKFIGARVYFSGDDMKKMADSMIADSVELVPASESRKKHGLFFSMHFENCTMLFETKQETESFYVTILPFKEKKKK